MCKHSVQAYRPVQETATYMTKLSRRLPSIKRNLASLACCLPFTHSSRRGVARGQLRRFRGVDGPQRALPRGSLAHQDARRHRRVGQPQRVAHRRARLLCTRARGMQLSSGAGDSGASSSCRLGRTDPHIFQDP